MKGFDAFAAELKIDSATGKVKTMMDTKNSFLIIGDTTSTKNVTASPAARGPGGFYHRIIPTLVSSTQIEQAARQLIRLAETVYGAREFDALDHISIVLCNMPSKAARDAGMYYRAIIAKRAGQLDVAQEMLEMLAEYSTIQARAVQTLANVFECKGDIDTAARLNIRAAYEARATDGLTFANASLQISSLKSIVGEHQAALNDLYTLWPTVKVIAPHHPHLFYFWHNEVAYELMQTGKIELAQRACAVAISSPIINQYSEWKETDAEIQQQASRPLIIAVPAIEKPAQSPKKARSSFITTNQPSPRNFNQWPTIKDNQITCQVISEWVKLCTPIRAPTIF